MRDRARQRLAAGVKSRRASPRELRQAAKRLREIQDELKQIELTPEAKQGEDRASRYSRVLRLRTMREDFEARMPRRDPDHPNGTLLALVMTIASFFLCASCVIVSLGIVQLINQKPDPTTAANGFWSAMEQKDYAQVRTNFFSSTLRVTFDQSQFADAAKQADDSYGSITNAVIQGPAQGDPNTRVTVTYLVTRSKNSKSVSYKATLALLLHGGTWGVDDLGATIDPHAAGLPSPSPTAAPQPTDTPAALRRDDGSAAV